MPRPPAIVPNTHIHTTLPALMATRLELFLFSEAEGKVPRGAYQQFLIQRINEFFTHRPLDLSPFLGTLPGEAVITGDAFTITRLLTHLKEVNSRDTGTAK